MSFKISIINETGISKEDIFWTIICQNASSQYCYVASDGSLVQMQVSDNTQEFGDNTITNCNGGYLFANYFKSLKDQPDIMIEESASLISAQLWVGLKSWVPFCAQPGGYAPPSVANPALQGYHVQFQFAEFNYANTQLNINTTNVDALGFPMNIIVSDTSENIQVTAYSQCYKWIIEQFKNCSDSNFSHLIIPDASGKETLRILSIEHAAAGPGGSQVPLPSLGIPSSVVSYFSSFYTSYISACWNLYSQSPVTIYIATLPYTGQVQNGTFNFWAGTAIGSSSDIVLSLGMPDNGSVLQAAGILDSGNAVQLNIEKFIAAALYRGVFHISPGNDTCNSWCGPDMQAKFYTGATANSITAPVNHYAKILHSASTKLKYADCDKNIHESANGCCYAYAYDDVGDQSSSLICMSPKTVTIVLPNWDGMPA